MDEKLSKENLKKKGRQFREAFCSPKHDCQEKH
jgi:hypothetical protein